MRTIRSTMIAGAIALPLTLGSAGLASADSYNESTTNVGPDGVSTQSVHAGSHGNGGTSYEESNHSAGPDGASSDNVSATSDGQGNASYQQDSAHAGPDGAGSSNTSAETGDREGPVSGLVGGLGL